MSTRKLRSSRDSVLSRLNQKKKALEKSRLRLVTELERIDESLKQIQADYEIFNGSSPLLNLPTEVTCMIFDFAVADCDKPLPPKSLPPEVVISHVCAQWRDVSLDYPHLWARFFFRAEKVDSSMRNSLGRFDEYMKRSKSQNLELFFNFGEEAHQYPLQPPRLKDQLDLLDTAIKQAERWKIVTVMATCALDVESRFLDLKFASVSNLEYLAYSPASPVPVDADHLSRSLDISNPGIFIGGAPKLRYLSFDCSSFILPPFSNITTLRLESLEDPTVPDIVYTFETFLAFLFIPSLVNLSLVGLIAMTPGDFRLNNLDVINMGNLKHLRYSDHKFMTLLLPFLRAPLLETLVIHDDDRLFDEDINHNALDSAAGSYFFPSLETLILINASPMSYESARRMKNLTKNIKNILISDNLYSSSVNFIGFLQEFGDDCWPRLASIAVNVIWAHYQVTSMLDLVRSRPMDACLKLRLFQKTHSDWKTRYGSTYREIQEHCTVEVLKAEEQAETVLMRPQWPPGVQCPDYSFRGDPFTVDWRPVII